MLAATQFNESGYREGEAHAAFYSPLKTKKGYRLAHAAGHVDISTTTAAG